MTASASAPNQDRGVDSWMDLTVRSVRERSYHIGRLFNRFSFHFDQAYALAYRFPKEGVAELRCAVSALNDIETAMKTFDPSRQDRWNALAEFRELIQDEDFLRRQFDGLREKCNARETAPEVHEIQWLCTRDRAVLPTELLQALSHGDEAAFQLGIVVDQGMRPAHVAAELYSATVDGESWPETPPQLIRAGDVKPDETWTGILATWLTKADRDIPAPNISDPSRQWFDVIHELDRRIRFEPPTAGRSSSRLEVDVKTLQVRWNGVAYKVSDKGAWFLHGLKLIFDDPDRHGEYVSARQLKDLLGIPKFRSDQAKDGLDPALLELVEKRSRTGGHRLKECVA